jgi:hypothetical protein
MTNLEPAIYREGCGTHLGMRMHQTNGEEPCGECRHGEQLRRLEAEVAVAPPISPWRVMTPRVAAENRRVLVDALGITDDTNTN